MDRQLLIGWFSRATVFLLLEQTTCLTFSVNLSSEVSHMYYGQLLAYFTFVEGGTASLSYEASGKISPSANLYLFATGNQHMSDGYSSATCHNLYKRSIRTVPLNLRKHYVLDLDPFSSHFPTLLVFADNSSCNRTTLVFADDSPVTITLLNPHNQPLSGTLIGIPTHVAGLFTVYAIAILYTLYCLCYSKRCTICHGVDRMDSFTFDSESRNDAVYALDGTVRRSTRRSCCSCTTSAHPKRVPYHRSHSCFSFVCSGQDKRLCYVLLLLCLQCSASLLAWLEFSTLSRTTLSTIRPVFGANGSRSHLAELFSLASHYVFMGLLISQLTDSCGYWEHQDTKDSLRKASHTSSSVNLTDSSIPTLPFSSAQRSFLPAFSVFRLGRTLSVNRLIWLLLCVQLIWYYALQQSNFSIAYAKPPMWPIDEQHGFWAGLGIPTLNYLSLEEHVSTITPHSHHVSPSAGFFARLHTMILILTGSTSFLSILLSVLCTGLGWTLSARLVQIARTQRFGELRNLCIRLGWLGTAWFAAHPLILLFGALFADYARYKVVLVGVTFIQVSVIIALLVLFTRQTLLWDISALSASLPLLKRIPSPHSK